MAISIGWQHYVEATGWVNAPDKDIVDGVNQQRNQAKQAVAGFDLTFSPAKSISVCGRWQMSPPRAELRRATMRQLPKFWRGRRTTPCELAWVRVVWRR